MGCSPDGWAVIGRCAALGRWVAGRAVNRSLTKSPHASAREPREPNMMRVRLKADGRLVEILSDGSERAMPPVPPEADGAIQEIGRAHV